MDCIQKGIITLIRSGLCGERAALPAGFELDAAMREIMRHQVAPIAYLGAVNCGISKELSAMKKLFSVYCQCLMCSEGQMREVSRIFAAFDSAGVDYMPLKGCKLKALYPKAELRTMNDADVLIRVGQYTTIRKIMEELGFAEQCESDHEFVWHSPALHLELHKRLIPSYNKDYYRYFGDGWKLAQHDVGGAYRMSDEDELIYNFTHFAKHYRDGGIGCRLVADLWVYIQKKPDMDFDYIRRELEKLRLYEFFENIRGVHAVWFEGAQESEKSAFITDFIFKSGAWGDRETHDISAGAKNAAAGGTIAAGKLRQAIGMLFPPYMVMRQKYPILLRAPVLLPIFWPVRWIGGLLLRRENVAAQRDKLCGVSVQDIKSYSQALDYVGLDFSFKE